MAVLIGAIKEHRKRKTIYPKDTMAGKLYVYMGDQFGKITDTTINLINSTKYVYKDKKGKYVYVASKGKDYGYVKYTKVYI